MINYISIKNFAIIEDAEINFHSGLNIITGETGAGKSVVVEAMALALGSRADTTYVRTGCEKAVIQMVAENLHEEYVITREISANGKNLCKINGNVVSLGELQSLTKQIADIHGQYDNQSLLNPDNHIKLVDSYEKNAIINAKQKVKDYFDDYKTILKRLKTLQIESDNAQKTLDLLQFQLDEINNAQLVVGEDTELKEKIKEYQNKEKIYLAFNRAFSIAKDHDTAVLDQLYDIQSSIKDITSLSNEAKEIGYELSDFYYKFEDIISKIRLAKDKVRFSNDDIEMLQDRLELVESLKKKYNTDISGLIELCSSIEKKLSQYKNLSDDIDSINIERERIGEMLKDSTEKLTQIRKMSASSIEENIQKELAFLNLNEAIVKINVSSLGKYTANGQDKIEFLISTNKGEPLKPLARIASGGEMSRIMLAFKSIVSEYDNIGTMIFDEIDSGISGNAADKVGKKLLSLGEKFQIISITHLPQIAALGDHNYKIQKISDGHRTKTTVIALNNKEKVVEVARLLSGDEISDIAIANAENLIYR